MKAVNRHIPLLLFFFILFSSCTESTIYYPDISPIETGSTSGLIDSYGNPFTYIHSEDSKVSEGIYPNAGFLMAGLYPDGEYLYFPMGRMLYRYNTVTGNLTTACADPLCMHDSEDCPFFNSADKGGGGGAQYASIFNNRIYFKTKIRDEANKVYQGTSPSGSAIYYIPTIPQCKVYDIATQTVSISKREYSETSTFYVNEYCTEDEEYYFDMIYNEETDQWSKALKCYDKKTQKNRVVRHVQGDPDMLFIKDEPGRLLYCDFVSIGWLDTQTGEKTPFYEGECSAVSCDQDYIYFIQQTEGTFWRMPFGGGTPEYLGISDMESDYHLSDKYIYFRYRKVYQVGSSLDGTALYFRGQEFMRMDKDGQNLTRLFSLKMKKKIYVLTTW